LGSSITTPVFPTGSTDNLFAAHTTWETGLRFRLPGDKLELSYNFEKQAYTAPVATTVYVNGSPGNTFYYYPAFEASTHHVNVMAKLVSGQVLQWQSGIGVTIIHSHTIPGEYPSEGTATGDFTSHISWTAGWVNRISCHRFMAGIDLLCHVNEYYAASYPYVSGVVFNKINSFDLHNIYIGYKLRMHKTNDIDVYIDSRDLLQNSTSDLTDRRRYYGAGFKTIL
jgi:hypothetical protein